MFKILSLTIYYLSKWKGELLHKESASYNKKLLDSLDCELFLVENIDYFSFIVCKTKASDSTMLPI